MSNMPPPLKETPLGEIPFIKACSLGNDFVIVDRHAIGEGIDLSLLSRILADRKNGIGCDQVIYSQVIYRESTVDPGVYVDNGIYKVLFFNADGSEAESCGNGSRCLAKILMEQHSLSSISLRTAGGDLDCHFTADSRVAIRFPKLPRPIRVDLTKIDYFASLFVAPLVAPLFAFYVQVGNPHLVCFLPEIVANQRETIIPLAITSIVTTIGPLLETALPLLNPSLPQRVNVGFATVRGQGEINLNVWERGAGYTSACGTGAAAAFLAALNAELVDTKVTISQGGGDLSLSLSDDGHILLTGEANTIYRGFFPLPSLQPYPTVIAKSAPPNVIAKSVSFEAIQ